MSETASIFTIPGIGQRTGKILHDAGVCTVGAFVRLPDLLLENTFGPSLPPLRKKIATTLSKQNSRSQFHTLLSRVGRELLT